MKSPLFPVVPLGFSAAFLLFVTYVHWEGFLVFFREDVSTALIATLTLFFCGICAFWFRLACKEGHKPTRSSLWVADFFNAAYFLLGAINIFFLVYYFDHPNPTVNAVVAFLFAVVITFATILVFQVLLITFCQLSVKEFKSKESSEDLKRVKGKKTVPSIYGKSGYINTDARKKRSDNKVLAFR